MTDLITRSSGSAADALDGSVFDHINTPIYDEALRQRFAQREVLMQMMADPSPLPTTEAREGYFGPRHIEYWLSGHRDAQRVVDATGLAGRLAARILDFGGATGRVIRHMHHWAPKAELVLTDINPRHVAVVQSLFGGRIAALRNQGVPSLPFPDAYFDVAMAFSVFTHIDVDDTAWLWELRRCIRPGGFLYLTVHDEATWARLGELVPMNASFGAPDLVALHDRTPTLSGKVAHYYNNAADYNCNVFVARDHIARVWGTLFASHQVTSEVHDHQAAVVFQTPAA